MEGKMRQALLNLTETPRFWHANTRLQPLTPEGHRSTSGCKFPVTETHQHPEESRGSTVYLQDDQRGSNETTCPSHSQRTGSGSLA
ncbi:hypothetical protein EYF80_003652 [Liparis tanakae]|uniref:Uncharacterized protein n=1 Tax=Liparis tanakae TaxID=230148 RepID=A0A4Z2J7B8_9TELE|nr:hypothetical protein EYF80_003652 [Liparis tanakae]